MCVRGSCRGADGQHCEVCSGCCWCLWMVYDAPLCHPSGSERQSPGVPLRDRLQLRVPDPPKEMGLRAFTLCMRVATELPEDRQIILFAYRTADYDELNVWRESDGRVSFYMSGDGIFFHLPHITTFRTSLCLTWDSRTGLSAFWVDGKRSTYQVYKPGHSIRPKGSILLGQDPDKHLGGLEAGQSFVGEMTDLNMWDFVLSRSMIQAWHYGHRVPKGNVFDWGTMEYELNGNVMVVDDD
ncbi:hypothetical protein NQZ68_031693 [Dissostichus eleginoides]|nr:hypothetical protein NQZ68_031693 [Dissostichus eleginoides]